MPEKNSPSVVAPRDPAPLAGDPAERGIVSHTDWRRSISCRTVISRTIRSPIGLYSTRELQKREMIPEILQDVSDGASYEEIKRQRTAS